MSADEKQIILGALDTLACALTEHGHVWTEGERTIYEQAAAILGAGVPDGPDVGEGWKE